MVKPEFVRGFLVELCKDAKVKMISPHKARHIPATLTQVARQTADRKLSEILYKLELQGEQL